MASIYSIMVARCEEKLDYTFSDKLPCATAINAGPGGVARLLDGHSHLIQKNDRIAILGDIVASERLAQLWLRQRLSKGNIPRACPLLLCGLLNYARPMDGDSKRSAQ